MPSIGIEGAEQFSEHVKFACARAWAWMRA